MQRLEGVEDGPQGATIEGQVYTVVIRFQIDIGRIKVFAKLKEGFFVPIGTTLISIIAILNLRFFNFTFLYK